MKLLIFTQVVDKNDSVLGFFHGWLNEFAKKYESITVICLLKGEYDLAQNVRVLSLGKEAGVSRLGYISNFYKYIFGESKNYDAVFVHMNQEYVLLGGIFWRLIGKKVFMWRNHPMGSFLTRVAVFLSNEVFCTSEYSFTAQFKKTKIMPVGIDTNKFKRDLSIEREPNSILFFGRISPVKHPDVFIEACEILHAKTTPQNFSARIVGDPLPVHVPYFENLKDKSKDLVADDVLKFEGAIPNSQAPILYNKYEMYVNTTPSGSFDKTILEAMACGVIVFTSNKSLTGLLDETFIFKEGDAHDLARKLELVLKWSQSEKEGIANKLHDIVKENHSVDLLMQKLGKEIVSE